MMKTLLVGIVVLMLVTSIFPSTAEAEKNLPKINIHVIRINESTQKPFDSFNVEISKPEKAFYLNDNKLFPLFFTTIIFGPITVKATVAGTAEKVEFYIDNTLKNTDFTEPYSWKWGETVFFKHTIKVKAYSTRKTIAEAETPVFIFNIQSVPQELTKEEAIEILINQVIKPSTLDHTIYAFTLDDPLREGDKIAPWLPEPVPASVEKFPYLIYREITKPTWFFWIDDVPRGKFAHENRFVFIDAVTGDVDVQEEKWWPVLNDVSLWNASKDYWNPDNWAYTNDENPPPLGSFGSKNDYSFVDTNIDSPSFGSEGAIVINGWSTGQTGEENFSADAFKMGLFWGTYPGFETAKVNPPDNNQSNVHNAFNETGDNKDVVVYITAHGGVDASGEPYVSCGGEKITEDDLCDMAKEHPNTTYKWVIDSCYSGNFMDSLKELNNTAKIVTACGKNEVSYFDWDPKNDPNPDDTGSEFSSGFYEDLWEEWLNNPSIDIVELLDKAFKSAVAKDACAINNDTHPQVWEKEDSDPPLIVITNPENNSVIPVPYLNVTGWASDTVSGIVYMDFLWEWEGGSYHEESVFDPPAPELHFIITLEDITPGWNKVTVGARDAVNNYGTNSVTFFYIPEDTIPPVTTKEVGQPNWDDGYTIAPYTPIWLNATDEGGSGVHHIYYEIAWDPDENGVWDYVFEETVYGDVAEIQMQYWEIYYGLVELRWYAVDNAENVEEMHYQQHHVVS